jgi:hypothetical protein
MNGKEESLINGMTADEFDLLDELYFVTSFSLLKQQLDWESERILQNLESLLAKGWVKCMNDASEEVAVTGNELANKYNNYNYLATKKGLLAHNGR